MAGTSAATGKPHGTGAGGPLPLVPILLLRRGRVCRPADDGPEPAAGRDGGPLDPFDVIDRLVRDYKLLYLVDLDGIERSEPQLDYIQEFSRDLPLWVDGGVRTADQSIDILVAGAQRAVVSTGLLAGPDELERAWGLSTELVVEVPIQGGRPIVETDWPETEAAALAASIRSAGPQELVLSFRENDPDWSMVRRLAAGGPVWVDGTFQRAQAPRLAEAGASGGLFHIDDILDELRGSAPNAAPAQSSSPALRDDED